MKYKQNQKIKQVSETTLIIGADIAKHKHIARAQDFRGIEFGKALTFENNRTGFSRLYHWIESLMVEHEKQKVIFGIEPTGHYWKPLAQFLRKHGIKIVMVNPMHVKKSKELDDNSPTKNDVKDARVIAQLVKDGRYSEPRIPTEIYAELRVGMNLRECLIENLKQIQGRVHNWLDRFFPEFLTVFKDWEGKAALLTLRSFPLPQEIVSCGMESIMKCWKSEVKTVGKKRAKLLVEVAKESVGLTGGIIMGRQELMTLLSQYNLIQQELEQLMLQIDNLVKEIPGAKEMITIPGVGMVTVAGFLAEVGNLDDYNHPSQIQKLAGLNLKENSSGKHKGRTCITKRGRSRLRALLYKCIMPLVAKNKEFQALHCYYTMRARNPLKKKQSLIALCCKLIRLLFTLGKKQMPYDSCKLREDSSNLSLQEAA